MWSFGSNLLKQGASLVAQGASKIGEYVPEKVTDAFGVVTEAGSSLLTTTHGKILEAKDLAVQLIPSEQANLKPLRQYIIEEKTAEIKKTLDSYPLLPIREVPQSESVLEDNSSFLAFAFQENKASFNAMISHDESMAHCLLSPDANPADIEHIVKNRPDLLLKKINFQLHRKNVTATVFNYIILKKDSGLLDTVLKHYVSSKHKLDSEQTKTINAIFWKYHDKNIPAVASTLNKYASSFPHNTSAPPSAREMQERKQEEVVAPPHQVAPPQKEEKEEKEKEKEKEKQNDTPKKRRRRRSVTIITSRPWDGLGEFQRIAGNWYTALRSSVWRNAGDKLEKMSQPAETLYQASQLINEDTVDHSLEEKKHILARQLSEHRRWSWYSWLGKQADCFKRSPTTSQEIVSLLVTMPKYKELKVNEQKTKDAPTSSTFSDKEEKLHDFQQAVCLNYLKKRGTVWLSNGDKAKKIAAVESPAILLKAAQIILSKATPSEAKQSKEGIEIDTVTSSTPSEEDKKADTLAKELSQHRRWSWFSSKRGHSAFVESLLDVVDKEEYKSLVALPK